MKTARYAFVIAGGMAAVSTLMATPFSQFALAGVRNNPGTTVSNGNDAPQTTTPIQHLVVIFDENVSFDHYFGTYPYAKNPAGEPLFTPSKDTPSVNGLTPELMFQNPNSVNPQRLDRSQALTPDMDHGYTSEQAAFDGGKMDQFVSATGHGNPIVMDYYDGNTVTALWEYAQHFAMSDNSFGTTFGPSTPGALNLISGQTFGGTQYSANVTKGGTAIGAYNSNGTVTGDPNPYYDKASSGETVAMAGKNVGDLLNAKGVTWGWFEGGFRDPSHQTANIGGHLITDYSPHHEPFQYFLSTANPYHLPPTSTQRIGQTDQANHQYDVTDFWAAADANNLPSVSFLKAPMAQDGHAGYSDPLDEQHFIVNTINRLEKLSTWKNTAVIISYDDSDGWYDHVVSPVINSTQLGGYPNRNGYGPRLPLLVISPYAKQNYVDHTVTDQSSILRFIEDNWNLGRIGNGSYDAIAGTLNSMFDFESGRRAPKLFLNPATGEPQDHQTEK